MSALAQPVPGGSASAALVQPPSSGSAPDPAAELRSTLTARVALEALWKQFKTDTTTAQDKAITAVASAQTFVDFSTQMDKIIQGDADFQNAKDKKETEAKWLDEHGVCLIKDNHKIAEAVEKDLEKSNQLKIFEDWEKAAKSKSASAAPAKPKAAKGKATGSPAGKKP